MKIVRHSSLLLLLILIAAPAQGDGCAQPYSDVVLPAGVSTISLSPSSLTSVQSSALSSAMSQWNGCGGSSPDFTRAPGGDLNIGVHFNDRQATSTDCGGPDICGCFDWDLEYDSTRGKQVIVGGSVELFDRSSNGVTCDLTSPNGVVEGMMLHELGHVLGLAQAGSGCSGRPMHPNLNQIGNVQSSDCDGVQEASELANESSGGSIDPGEDNQECAGICSPILIDLDRRGFKLSSADEGADFDVDADGFKERVGWVEGGDGFLVLDRNGNGRIDDGTELFGDSTSQPPSAEPNGYNALAVFDAPATGGNGDGRISAEDSVFAELRIWTDGDGDGETDPGEIAPLFYWNIQAIPLRYRMSRSRDRHGNEFRYWSIVWLTVGRTRAVDVLLTSSSN